MAKRKTVEKLEGLTPRQPAPEWFLRLNTTSERIEAIVWYVKKARDLGHKYEPHEAALLLEKVKKLILGSDWDTNDKQATLAEITRFEIQQAEDWMERAQKRREIEESKKPTGKLTSPGAMEAEEKPEQQGLGMTRDGTTETEFKTAREEATGQGTRYIPRNRRGKKALNVFLEPETLIKFKKVAKAHGMRAQEYMAVMVDNVVAKDAAPEKLKAIATKTADRNGKLVRRAVISALTK